MSTHCEIQKIRKEGAVLRYVVLSIAAAGILGTVFMAGGREGYGYGYHKAIATVKAAVQASQYPMVYLTYPGKQAAAMFVNGVCIPYPSPKSIPAFHHYRYVSPRWVPCATQHYNNPVQESPALAAITKGATK